MVLVVDQTLVMVSRSQGRCPVGVDEATPDVDDRLAVDQHGDRGPDVAPAVDALEERLSDCLKPRITGAVDVSHGVRSFSRPASYRGTSGAAGTLPRREVSRRPNLDNVLGVRRSNLPGRFGCAGPAVRHWYGSRRLPGRRSRRLP